MCSKHSSVLFCENKREVRKLIAVLIISRMPAWWYAEYAKQRQGMSGYEGQDEERLWSRSKDLTLPFPPESLLYLHLSAICSRCSCFVFFVTKPLPFTFPPNLHLDSLLVNVYNLFRPLQYLNSTEVEIALFFPTGPQIAHQTIISCPFQRKQTSFTFRKRWTNTDENWRRVTKANLKSCHCICSAYNLHFLTS